MQMHPLLNQLLIVPLAFAGGFASFKLGSTLLATRAIPITVAAPVATATAYDSSVMPLPTEFIQLELNGSSLMVARNETSMAHWSKCVAAGVCQLPEKPYGRPDHPVTNVSWKEVQAYIRWFADLNQLPVRVPTRAEWLALAAEHAPVKRKPLFTDPRMAWAADYDMTAVPQSRVTEPLGSFGQNRYGLNDLQGNVWEWVDDCYFTQTRNSEGDCSGGRAVMGERPSGMDEDRRKPGNVGCYGEQPPANVGFRLVYSLPASQT